MHKQTRFLSIHRRLPLSRLSLSPDAHRSEARDELVKHGFGDCKWICAGPVRIWSSKCSPLVQPCVLDPTMPMSEPCKEKATIAMPIINAQTDQCIISGREPLHGLGAIRV